MTEKPPDHLSREARKIWKDVCEGWTMDARSLPLLRCALESWDEMQRCRKIIDETGMAHKLPTGAFRKNPACEILSKARDGFLRSWQSLNLDVPAPRGH
jgi:P27 family predicted phage terminase small subunit